MLSLINPLDNRNIYVQNNSNIVSWSFQVPVALYAQIRYVVLFATVLCLVQSQRPWHAGSSNRYPQVLPQYLDERAAAEQAAQVAQAAQAGLQAGQAGLAAQAAQAGQAGQAGQTAQGIQPVAAPGTSFDNRVNAPTTDASAALATTTLNPLDLPVDAHGDVDLVNRIKTWPRDKQPFWYINWQAIQAHRGDANNSAQPPQTQPNVRSFFAG